MMSASSRAARRKDHRSEAEKLPPPTCRPPADTVENTCHWLQFSDGNWVIWWWRNGRWCWMARPNRRAPEGIWPLEMGASGWTYVGPVP